MSWKTLEREEEILEREFEDGALSRAEYNKALRELHRDARAEVEEEAERAADEVRKMYGYGGGW